MSPRAPWLNRERPKSAPQRVTRAPRAVTIAVVHRSVVPHTTLKSSRASLRFYLGDCLDVLSQLPERSVDVIVTSPPYNLGIRYRSYDDTMPRGDYLKWTAEWIQHVARVLSPEGSLFLNVGAKPTDPWTAIDIAHAVRPFASAKDAAEKKAVA